MAVSKEWKVNGATDRVTLANDPASIEVVGVCPVFLLDLGYVNVREVDIEPIEKRGVSVWEG